MCTTLRTVYAVVDDVKAATTFLGAVLYDAKIERIGADCYHVYYDDTLLVLNGRMLMDIEPGAWVTVAWPNTQKVIAAAKKIGGRKILEGMDCGNRYITYLVTKGLIVTLYDILEIGPATRKSDKKQQSAKPKTTTA